MHYCSKKGAAADRVCVCSSITYWGGSLVFIYFNIVVVVVVVVSIATAATAVRIDDTLKRKGSRKKNCRVEQ